jgi:hypothetical protein
MLDEIVDAVMKEIEDEINGYVDEYVTDRAPELYKSELRQQLKVEVAKVLAKHGILRTP